MPPAIIVRRFKEGMQLPPNAPPNSSLSAYSKTFECEVALHRMSNGELWLVRLGKDRVWYLLRAASGEDCKSFIDAHLAFLGGVQN